MDKLQQKQRWKYCLEKFSHAQTGIVRRSLANHWVGHVLDMPELKKGRFVAEPGTAEEQGSEGGSVSTPPKQQVSWPVQPMEHALYVASQNHSLCFRKSCGVLLCVGPYVLAVFVFLACSVELCACCTCLWLLLL